ncbi:MAG: potassium channel protein [Planctomycetota bacterium]
MPGTREIGAVGSSLQGTGRRFARALIIIAGITVLGTAGYHFIEGWSVFDSLYMTVITMATVGYGETHPLTPEGRGFTIFLIVCSVGMLGYAVSMLASFVAEGEFQRLLEGRRMDKAIAGLSGHIVLCGGGHTGKCIADEFRKSGTLFVLVERDRESLRHVLALGDVPHIEGDASEDDCLRQAGIDRARGLVAALGEDKDNVFVVLSARALNPRLRIVARLVEEENAEKLRKAGADEFVSPNAIGGLRMASLMVRPAVVKFLDTMIRAKGAVLRVEEVGVASVPGLAGKTLGAADIARRTGLLVMALLRGDGEYIFNPPADTVVREGDILIVMGTREQLAALKSIVMGTY